MFICPKCHNLYDISNVQPKGQQGGNDDYKTIIDIILDKKNIDNDKVNKINVDKLIKNPSFVKLSTNDKEYVLNYIKDRDLIDAAEIIKKKDEGNKCMFMCMKCGTKEPVVPGTLIYTESIASNDRHPHMHNMVHSNILPLTRKYTCPAKTCKSHTDPSKREAKMFRVGKTSRVRYICMECSSSWYSK